MKPFLFRLILVALSATGFTTLKNTPVIDYLNIPGPIKFTDTAFNLSWSANPNASYFKQEYLPSGEVAEHFNQMVLVEVLYGEVTAADVLKAQAARIDQRKASDPVARYQVIENPENGELILDFLMSSAGKKGMDVAEWNAYRYKNIRDQSGRKGVLMFGISKRSYGEKITKFLTTLKTDKTATVNALAAYALPQVAVKR